MTIIDELERIATAHILTLRLEFDIQYTADTVNDVYDVTGTNARWRVALFNGDGDEIRLANIDRQPSAQLKQDLAAFHASEEAALIALAAASGHTLTRIPPSLRENT